MPSFIARHQGRLIAVAAVLGFAGMIWLDARRETAHDGEPLPSLELRRLEGGEPVKLDALRGKPVVLDFWASWCGPCRRGLPAIDRLARAHANDAHVFAVNAEDESDDIQTGARTELGLSLPMLADGARASALLHVEVLPTTVVIDRDGHIARTFTGASSDEAIADLLETLK